MGYIFEYLMFLFKNRDKFENANVHSNYTRTNNLLYPCHRLTITEKHPYYICIKFYNKLPNIIKSITGVPKWKKTFKKVLIDIEPYTVEDFLNKEW